METNKKRCYNIITMNYYTYRDMKVILHNDSDSHSISLLA